MSEKLFQEILQELREGMETSTLFSCGCMGCQNRVNGICACEQAGYSPNGVRRPCKCCCQIPEVKARNEQRKSEMRAYLDRASSQLLSEGYTLIGMRFVKSDQ